MDLSKLGQNEKLALYGAIAVVLAGLVSNWGSLLWLSILAAIGVAIVVFLPQFSPKTALPGSKGSILAVLGFVALGAAAIDLLRYLSYTLETLGNLGTLLFIVAALSEVAGPAPLLSQEPPHSHGAAGHRLGNQPAQLRGRRRSPLACLCMAACHAIGMANTNS